MVYGCMVFVEFRERADAGVILGLLAALYALCLCSLSTGNTALKLLISLLHCQALKDKVGRNIVK